jgi:type IV fimbrial biogenesis protein FimT
MGTKIRQSGFTLIELMMVIVVLAIVLAIGVPSFRTLIINNRVTGEANDFAAALNIARSEAIKRRVNVTLTAASGSSWEAGWTVTAGGTTLRVQQTFKPGSTLRGLASGGGAVSSIVFDAGGYLASANPPLTFDLCNGNATQEKQITVVAGGRVNLESDYDCP